MNTTTYFLFFVCVCVGAAIGGLVQRALDRRSNKANNPPPAEPLEPAKRDESEILRAGRANGSGVWIEMDGRRLENKDTLQASQRQRLLNLVIDLRPWLEGPRTPAAPAAPIANGQPPAPTVPAAPPTGRPKDAPGGEAKSPLAPKSIVEQINDILQARLNLSIFKDRKISLVEGPGGAVIVKDGLNSYEGIDAVPDAEVKAFIRAAVAEWEKGSH